ncbi:hypothetical protein OROHE_018657 [Orobanche hederae]
MMLLYDQEEAAAAEGRNNIRVIGVFHEGVGTTAAFATFPQYSVQQGIPCNQLYGSVYKRVPEEWLKKQSSQKQHNVLKFLQRLKFWQHDNKPYMDDGFTRPTRHGKAKQSFIVGLEAHPFGQIVDPEAIANSHYELLAPYVGRKLRERFFTHINVLMDLLHLLTKV